MTFRLGFLALGGGWPFGRPSLLYARHKMAPACACPFLPAPVPACPRLLPPVRFCQLLLPLRLSVPAFCLLPVSDYTCACPCLLTPAPLPVCSCLLPLRLSVPAFCLLPVSDCTCACSHLLTPAPLSACPCLLTLAPADCATATCSHMPPLRRAIPCAPGPFLCTRASENRCGE